MSVWFSSVPTVAAAFISNIIQRCVPLAVVACFAGFFSVGSASAAPTYFSYWGLARHIPEAQDHVNLYWAVSWIWDSNEALSQLADAKARGMRAVVHTEFVFFIGSGQFGNTCPYTLRADAAARWDAFVQTLSQQALLDTVAAFYPLDEPDVCNASPNTVLTVVDIIRSHPLTAGKPVATTFGCDIAKRFGDPDEDDHAYGNALRAFDWVGVDCYGNSNIFIEPAWSRTRFDFGCFCFRTTYGPPIYDNFKLQLTPSQRVILVPQGFASGEEDGLPDDPQLFANKAYADPSAIAIVPFTWFDQLYYPGVRSQPSLLDQWRTIGRTIGLANPPNASPPLPAAVPPKLQVIATDVRHFMLYDVNCNTTTNQICEVQLSWWLTNSNVTQVFVRSGGGAPQLITCSSAMGFVDIPWMMAGSYTFELHQMSTCTGTIPPGTTPVASLFVTLPDGTAPPALVERLSRKTHGGAGTFNLPLAVTISSPTTEPRAGGAGNEHTIVFTFDKPVASGTATVLEGVATAGTPSFSGTEMIVPLSGVANAQYVSVSVSNVTATDGTSGGSGSVRVGLLLGDINGSRSVSLSDMLLANAALSQTVTPGNYLNDVNASGTLTLSDLLVINSALTQTLPAP